VARRSENLEAIRQTVAKIRAGEIRDLSQVKFDEIVQVEELQIDDIEPLRAELDSFIAAVVNKTTPEVTVEHGLAAVEVATRIVESIKTERL
jgi:predicted dehydrogenase